MVPRCCRAIHVRYGAAPAADKVRGAGLGSVLVVFMSFVGKQLLTEIPP